MLFLRRLFPAVIALSTTALLLTVMIFPSFAEPYRAPAITIQEIASVRVSSQVRDVKYQDEIVYLATDHGPLSVNVANPTRPVVRESGDLAYGEAVDVHESLVYVASGGGTAIFDYTNPAHAVRRGMAGYSTSALAASHGYLYAAEPYGILHTFDIHDPDHLIEYRQMSSGHHPGPIIIQHPLMYIANVSGVDILSLDNPTKPTYVGGIYGTSARAVTVIGTIAYVSAGAQGVLMYDITDLNRPIQLSAFSIGGNASDVEIVDHRAFVADSEQGIQIFDVSDLRQPVWLGSYADSPVQRLEVVDTIIYAATGNHGLKILRFTLGNEAVAPTMPFH